MACHVYLIYYSLLTALSVVLCQTMFEWYDELECTRMQKKVVQLQCEVLS